MTAPGSSDTRNAPAATSAQAATHSRTGKRAQPLRSVMGVDVHDITMDEALALIDRLATERPRKAHSIFFVNTHSLNVRSGDPEYQRALAEADHVFGDGTGVRWAVRFLHGAPLRDNVNGTDLVPLMFERQANLGRSYFMLGNTPERIELAAEEARRRFPGWKQAGYHHGFLDESNTRHTIEQINASGADVLLVGMGNPLQEKWIHDNLAALKVPVCMGIGGLFDYWAGEIERAPAWLRQVGHEWAYLLVQQPHKFRRYILGNPTFLLRVARERLRREMGRVS